MTANRLETVEQAKANPEYRTALTELLYQLADDDLVLSFRGSEWLGLAPHVEEDVAFSSITQDTMGHAAAFYGLLEGLGEGKADDLAHLREANRLRNAILVERPNGTGHYLNNPRYDWGYTVVRQYVYEIFKQERLESLTRSSFAPLAQLARKMRPEQRYHLLHWQTWFSQLANSTEEARQRIMAGVERVWTDAGGLFDLGPYGQAIVNFGLIEDGALLAERWTEKVKRAFEANSVPWPGNPQQGQLNGRAGQHTDDLKSALAELAEVYRLAPAANW
ncbi:1,2-phenylacetyl-CoA epoxidase subunit PaaC [Effusibacillus lacus]|uniref:Phenylacetate-CoA oxygenase n=1 Tax=Effusibacillus lacus TaxID=1348429 RepID=A0A292YHN3_9BACL|nr:1,2-phenylacetyl-CoA epoxidase subunit PaaC [Effusibacillus lacus]TCS72804.1 ring-1,2-phenylacetyl-CoA epoxidase subunit PaaC [Effusibacillus lacus]GAX89268.1 phenylacetate-CoA oxygenase [Effusibacillus lacus]